MAALGAAPAAGQEPSLCDALSLDDVHALGQPRFAEPVFGSPDFCFYEVDPLQQGPHTLNLNLTEYAFGLTYDDVLASLREQDPGLREVAIGSLPGFVQTTQDGTSVGVGLDDDHFLSVTASVAGSAEAGDLDEGEYALRIAELVVPALGTMAPAHAPDTPEVAGLRWNTARDVVGAELEAALQGPERELWDRLLAASGAGFEAAGLRDARAFDEAAEETRGQFMAMRVAGSDTAVLLPALIEWLAGLGGGQFEFTDATLAGRAVTLVSSPGQADRVVLLGIGDTVYIISMPEETAAKVIEALP